MEILWLAIVFYSIGLGLVLHFKPAVMFNENGTWKEFGYQRSSGSRHTLFPFWLFAVTWAFMSYALATGISWVFPAFSGLAATGALASSFYQNDYSDSEEDEEEEIQPVSEPPRRGRGRPKGSRKTETVKPRPGYYVVDPESEKGGLRKYIYYGSEPPQDKEL